MENIFDEYLNSIGANGIIKKRVEELFNITKKLIKEEIKDVIIENYKNSTRNVFTHLSFFSDSYSISFENFQSENICVISKFNNKIAFLKIIDDKYDFTQANDDSSLFVEIRYGNQIGGTFKVFGQNCDYLWKIINNYFIPNLGW